MSLPRVTTPVPRDVWREVHAADPYAMAFQSPEWLEVILASGRYEDASRLYELGDGRLGVLPCVRSRLAGGVPIESSYPLDWEAGGLIAHGGPSTADAQRVFEDAKARRVLRFSLRPNPLTAPAWELARPPGVTALPRMAHVLDLDGGFDRVWSTRFAGSARTDVRKAEKAGLRIERDTTGRLLPVFYELYDRSLARWAGERRAQQALARWQAHRRKPLSLLQRIARLMSGRCRTWVAWHEDQPAAAIIVIFGPSASNTMGAMHKELAAPTRANYMLHRLAIEEACAEGCRFYHMGDTGTSAPLAHFKTRLGAEPHPYLEFHVEALPLTRLDASARRAARRLLGFATAGGRR